MNFVRAIRIERRISNLHP